MDSAIERLWDDYLKLWDAYQRLAETQVKATMQAVMPLDGAGKPGGVTWWVPRYWGLNG